MVPKHCSCPGGVLPCLPYGRNQSVTDRCRECFGMCPALAWGALSYSSEDCCFVWKPRNPFLSSYSDSHCAVICALPLQTLLNLTEGVVEALIRAICLSLCIWSKSDAGCLGVCAWAVCLTVWCQWAFARMVHIYTPQKRKDKLGSLFL